MNINYTHFFLVLTALVVEVSPFFMGTKIPSILLFILLALIFFIEKPKFDFKVLGFSIVVVGLSFFQSSLYGGRSIAAPFAFVLFTILTPYLLFKIVGMKVFDYLSKILYIIAIYTFFIWLLGTINHSFLSFLTDLSVTVYDKFNLGDSRPRALLFYTVPFSPISYEIEILRNNGIFHEPGALGFWMVIGLAVNLFRNSKLWTKENIWILISLFSSFSSTAYIQLAIILCYFYVVAPSHNLILKIILILGFSFGIGYAYFSISFLGDKIERIYERESVEDLSSVSTLDRFANLRRTVNVIQAYPITGYGIVNSDEIISDKTSTLYVGNASLGIIARYGIFLGLTFYFYYFRGYRVVSMYYETLQKNKLLIYFILASVLLGGFSQRFVNDSVTNVFFIIGLLYNKAE